jgi:hypothetical protein
MLQVSSLFARICMIALVAFVCAVALSGWASTGQLSMAQAWALWFLRGLWSNPITRALSIAAVSVELWHRLTMSEVWS